MIHVYHGNGKGKTSAAIGLAIRCCGAGRSVAFTQLMKGNISSEIEILKRLPDIHVQCVGKQFGFYKNMSDQDILEITHRHNEMLSETWNLVRQSNVSVVILDEMASAYQYGLLNPEIVEQLIAWENRSKMDRDLVITGRNPDPQFLKKADYMTEMLLQRHPYEKGVAAREGIEW